MDNPDKIEWRECSQLPVNFFDAQIVHFKDKVYVADGDTDDPTDVKIYIYDYTADTWTAIDSPAYWSTLTVYKGALTLVGGKDAVTDEVTNQLWVLKDEGNAWIQPLPPMPTERSGTSAVSTQTHLIVAGGWRGLGETLDTVEVCDSLQWSTAQALPRPCSSMKSATYKEQWYLIGGYGASRDGFCVSLGSLVVSTYEPASVWEILPGCPLEFSSPVVCGNQLIAIGGLKGLSSSSAIHIYLPRTQLWVLIEDMPVSLTHTSALVLPTGELLVIGGESDTPWSNCVLCARNWAKVFSGRVTEREGQLYHLCKEQQRHLQQLQLQTKQLQNELHTKIKVEERMAICTKQVQCLQEENEELKDELIRTRKEAELRNHSTDELQSSDTASVFSPPQTVHSATQHNSTPAHCEGPMCGVEVLTETYFSVSKAGCTFEWKGYGLKLHIPEGSLPISMESCKFFIKVSLSGQYKLPDESQLVSPIFWISAPENFLQPIIIEIQHCAIKDETSVKDLSFITAQSTVPNLPYEFSLADKGVFYPNSSYGSIPVTHFSGWGIASKKGCKQAYQAQVYISRPKKETYEWRVYLVIARDIKAVLTYIHQYYSDLGHVRRDTAAGVKIIIQKSKVSLDIPVDGVCTQENWKITPRSYPCISKKDLDEYKVGLWIPEIELIVDWESKHEEPTRLRHKITLNGAKPPLNTILICINPEQEATKAGSIGAKTDTLHLVEVTGYLLTLEKIHVYNLGLVLGLCQHKVKTWKESETFLDDVIAAWLRKEDEVTAKGEPSWKTLVMALRHPRIRQNGIAREICRAKDL